MPMPRKPDPMKHCAACGQPMERRRTPTGRLEDRAAFLKRKFCGRACMARAMLSSDPSTSYLRRFRKTACETCGSMEKLHVHHMDEDRTNNSPENLKTLCASCHTRWHWENGKSSQTKPTPTCEVCDKPARHSGLCPTHRSRFLRHGSPYLVKRRIGSTWQLVEERG